MYSYDKSLNPCKAHTKYSSFARDAPGICQSTTSSKTQSDTVLETKEVGYSDYQEFGILLLCEIIDDLDLNFAYAVRCVWCRGTYVRLFGS